MTYNLSYKPIVAYHNRQVTINNMDEFASYFCYLKKQKSVPVNK